MTFLSYGTTARVARFFGSGERAAAVKEGTQATWLALAIGAVITIAVEAAAVPLLAVIASRGDIAGAALPWLRIAILGAPAILVTLAGNGWMRGVQDTVRPLRYVTAGFGLSALLCPLLVYGWLGLPRWGLPGSAVANLAGQWLAALLFGRALLAEQISLRIDRAVLRAQLVLDRDLFVRVVAFQVCFVSAAAVAARFGAATIAAHQVVMQLWNFLALLFDSLAIAAQALVGAALGAGNAEHAKSVAWRIAGISLLAATVLALLLGAGAAVVPELFTHDRSVLTAIHVPWWFLAAQLPLAGIVWGLDGVLLGAGDAKFLRNTTVISALIGFLPLIWMSLVFGWGAFRDLVRTDHVYGAATGFRRCSQPLRTLGSHRNRVSRRLGGVSVRVVPSLPHEASGFLVCDARTLCDPCTFPERDVDRRTTAIVPRRGSRKVENAQPNRPFRPEPPGACRGDGWAPTRMRAILGGLPEPRA